MPKTQIVPKFVLKSAPIFKIFISTLKLSQFFTKTFPNLECRTRWTEFGKILELKFGNRIRFWLELNSTRRNNVNFWQDRIRYQPKILDFVDFFS